MKYDVPCSNKAEKLFVDQGHWNLSFERVSLVEYACQIWSLYLLRFKSYSEGQSSQQIGKLTNRETNRQDNKNVPRWFYQSHKTYLMGYEHVRKIPNYSSRKLNHHWNKKFNLLLTAHMVAMNTNINTFIVCVMFQIELQICVTLILVLPKYTTSRA